MTDETYVPGQTPAVREDEVFVLPHSGEVVSLSEEVTCAVALDEVRRMQAHLNEAVKVLSAAIAARGAVLGSKTVKLSGGRKAVISGGTAYVYDAQDLEQRFREAGMPEERIREIIREEITYKVNATEAKRAAGANPEYARALEAVRSEHEVPYRVDIRRQ